MNKLLLPPSDFDDDLRLLGKQQWATFEQQRLLDGRWRIFVKFSEDELLKTSSKFLDLWDKVDSYDKRTGGAEGHGLQFLIYAYSRLLGNGVKLVRPTAEQCEALGNVKVHIKTEDYQQPFETILLQLPDQYRAALRREFNLKVQPFILIFHERQSQAIMIFPIESVWDDGTNYNYISRDIIEWSLSKRNDLTSSESNLLSALSRLAINFCLLLVKYGFEKSPLDPKRFAKLQQQAKSRNKNKAFRAKQEMRDPITLLGFPQNLVFSRRETQSHRESKETGRKVSPHWRSGYMRMQPHGEGWKLRKLIFIPPVFVNFDLFQGDLSDTSYVKTIAKGIEKNVPPSYNTMEKETSNDLA